MRALEFSGPATPLSEKDFQCAADELGCTPEIIHAVCDVESSGSGFLPDKRPKIRFETSVFYRLTEVDLPSPVARGAPHYDRLHEAIAIDREAALKSTSWGRFQILGENYQIAGYYVLDEFIHDMCQSEWYHLEAFIDYCISTGADACLIRVPPDFSKFAKLYNGEQYAVNKYDVKLQLAYQKWLNKSNKKL
jgi:N-acetylmuramidase